MCAVVKRKLSIAGRDYAHETTCLACFAGGGSGGKAAAGGELFLRCRLCPMALHSGCARHLGCQEVHGQVGGVTFTCPHHACGECGRKAPAAGGMLFRCEACPKAFCEDCLPDDAQIITDNPHFAPLGYVRQKSACFVTCSEACAARQNEGLRGS